MEIRQASIEDLPQMETMAKDFYANSRFLKKFNLNNFIKLWTQLLSSETGVIYLLVDEGVIVGTLGGVIYPDTYSEDLIATEFFWWVSERKRGEGLKLYYRFEEWAKEKKCQRIRMAHLCDLMPEKLKWLYGELGFLPVEINYEKELPL